ncbi:MAG: hypothetical protein IJS56_02155 [Bacilli bacterium]|nr:hypothetical protein [Bacilli bacterium]
MSFRFKNIILSIGLLFVFPMVVNAELPGARSATNEAGDVFLGGNYIEVGISKSGSFGTSLKAPEEFHSHALSAYSYKLGLIADGDGWDVGNPPTSGDFFLPGNPYEGYIFSYVMNGNSYVYRIAERSGDTWDGKYFTAPSVVDQSDIAHNKLKAVFSVVTKEKVKLELTIEFGVDDVYYSTLVNVINMSENEITDVIFTRDLDPDNDKDLNGTYDTYNKVPCNPDTSVEGSATNFAMVVAVGPVTYNGFFFVSFDNRAMGLIGNTAPSGIPTYADESALEITSSNANGYSLMDTRIQLQTKLKNLKSNESDETIFYSSLDPNVIQSISKILKAVAAKVKGLSDTRIEVETQEGYEYSIDNGEHWQDSGVFENLEPGKEYVVLSRIKATETEEASEPEETKITTKHSSKESPDLSEIVVTENEVVIKSDPLYEYSIDNGEHWQDSSLFTGLEPDTEYTIIARIKETSTDMPGYPTEPIVIHTPAKIQTTLDDVDNVSIDVIVKDDAPGVIIHKGLLYESVMDNEDVKNYVDDNHDVKLIFDVEAIQLDEEELNVVKEKSLGDTIAFTVNATIKLYADSTYVKDIVSSDKKITFTLKVPNEFVKKGRKFSVIRKHVGENDYTEYEVLTDEDNDDTTITISSDKFSEFTIIYNDSSNPKTSDNLLTYVFILFISVSALFIVKRY